jgi:hypothetical protein
MFRNVKQNTQDVIAQKRHSTLRTPKNIPYAIDNLLEWKRPDGYPSRRYATFAYPSLPVAQENVRDGQMTCAVQILGQSIIAQIADDDAKYHVDITTLQNVLSDIFGASTVTHHATKNEAGVFPEGEGLFKSVLTKAEVDALFAQPDLAPHRDRVWNAITFWDSVHLVPDGAELPFPKGEVFFDAEEWELRRV